jgi:CYTH domain-containing protein
MIELERTFLAKELPENLSDFSFKEMIDLYIPEDSLHPVMRIRKNGDKYEITKKEPTEGADSSVQREQTIILEKDEFETLLRVGGKKVSKDRYLYKIDNYNAEIDIFKDNLAGLVLVDVEFKNEEDKDDFKMPDFCLIEVTQEKFLAGGMLAGKSYEDIESDLDKLNYKKLNLEKKNR